MGQRLSASKQIDMGMLDTTLVEPFKPEEWLDECDTHAPTTTNSTSVPLREEGPKEHFARDQSTTLPKNRHRQHPRLNLHQPPPEPPQPYNSTSSSSRSSATCHILSTHEKDRSPAVADPRADDAVGDDQDLDGSDTGDDCYFTPRERRQYERRLPPLAVDQAHRVSRNSWKKGELLGGGAYGEVYLALDLSSGALFAAKEVRFLTKIEKPRTQSGKERKEHHGYPLDRIQVDIPSGGNGIFPGDPSELDIETDSFDDDPLGIFSPTTTTEVDTPGLLGIVNRAGREPEHQNSNCNRKDPVPRVHDRREDVEAPRSDQRMEVQRKIDKLMEEIEVMRGLCHPNIVRYCGTECSPTHIIIFMEYVVGGSIAELLRKFGKFNETLIRVYTKEVLLGLDYLHCHRIIHRDIKGANILVDKNGACKLADFGASQRLADLAGSSVKSLRGTPYWMAPEVIKQSGHGRHADIWSVGCTIFEMAEARPPYSEYKTHISAMFHIATSTTPPEFPPQLSEEAHSFLSICFRPHPKERWNAKRLLQHPFITSPHFTPRRRGGIRGLVEPSKDPMTMTMKVSSTGRAAQPTEHDGNESQPNYNTGDPAGTSSASITVPLPPRYAPRINPAPLFTDRSEVEETLPQSSQLHRHSYQHREAEERKAEVIGITRSDSEEGEEDDEETLQSSSLLDLEQCSSSSSSSSSRHLACARRARDRGLMNTGATSRGPKTRPVFPFDKRKLRGRDAPPISCSSVSSASFISVPGSTTGPDDARGKNATNAGRRRQQRLAQRSPLMIATSSTHRGKSPLVRADTAIAPRDTTVRLGSHADLFTQYFDGVSSHATPCLENEAPDRLEMSAPASNPYSSSTSGARTTSPRYSSYHERPKENKSDKKGTKSEETGGIEGRNTSLMRLDIEEDDGNVDIEIVELLEDTRNGHGNVNDNNNSKNIITINIDRASTDNVANDDDDDDDDVRERERDDYADDEDDNGDGLEMDGGSAAVVSGSANQGHKDSLALTTRKEARMSGKSIHRTRYNDRDHIFIERRRARDDFSRTGMGIRRGAAQEAGAITSEAMRWGARKDAPSSYERTGGPRYRSSSPLQPSEPLFSRKIQNLASHFNPLGSVARRVLGGNATRNDDQNGTSLARRAYHGKNIGKSRSDLEHRYRKGKSYNRATRGEEGDAYPYGTSTKGSHSERVPMTSTAMRSANEISTATSTSSSASASVSSHMTIGGGDVSHTAAIEHIRLVPHLPGSAESSPPHDLFADGWKRPSEERRWSERG